MTDEEKHHSSWTVEGRTELDLVQDEVDEAKRLLEEAHVEVQAAQNTVTESAFQVGQAKDEMARSRNCWRRIRNQPANEDRPEEASAGRHQKGQKPCGKDGIKPSWRRRNCRAARTSQYSVSISVRP